LKKSRLPSWKEDWQFLENQRKIPQVGHMEGPDRQQQDIKKRRAEIENKATKSISNKYTSDTLESSSTSLEDQEEGESECA